MPAPNACRQNVRAWGASLLLACAVISPARAADASPELATNQTTVLLVVGAAGEPEFGRNFSEWADLWETAARQGGAPPQQTRIQIWLCEQANQRIEGVIIVRVLRSATARNHRLPAPPLLAPMVVPPPPPPAVRLDSTWAISAARAYLIGITTGSYS